MKHTKLNRACFALAFVGAISLVNAQDMPGNMGYRMGGYNMGNGMGMNCGEGLNLTSEQRLKMIELRKSFFEGNQDKREARRDAMQKLMNAEQLDEAAVTKLMDEREAERKQTRMNQMKFKFEMNKILTPEQRKLQNEYQKNGFGRMQGNMNNYMNKGYKNHENRGHRMHGYNRGNGPMHGGYGGMMGQGYMNQDD